LTGYYGGEATLGRETMENQQANQLLQLAASLRGPENAFQFAKVIGGTPGGLQDVLASMAGRYALPGFSAPNAAPSAVNLGNFTQQVAGTAAGTYNPQVGSWSTPSPAIQVNPPGAQAPSNAFNYQPTGDGNTMVYPPGITAPQQAAQVSSTTPLSGSSLAQFGAQSLAQQPYELPNPSQWNAANWGELGDYRQKLALAGYEAAGWDPEAALDVFNKSLPTSGGPTASTIKIPGLT
jgi:hypothetical protein